MSAVINYWGWAHETTNANAQEFNSCYINQSDNYRMAVMFNITCTDTSRYKINYTYTHNNQVFNEIYEFNGRVGTFWYGALFYALYQQGIYELNSKSIVQI